MPKYPKLPFLQANDNEQFKKCVRAYLACITFVDHQLGRVLDALDASPYADNTIVVLFSDHGYHIGEKNRVSKHSLWEESTHVPMIIQKPGGPSGKKCKQPVGLIDLYPTLLELTGLPPKIENEGISLVPLLKNPKADWRFAVLTTYARGNYALRSDRYHYIRYDDGAEELYDHKNDPNEWKNLASNPEHTALLEQFRNEVPTSSVPYHSSQSSSPVNEWFKQHLTENGVTGSSKKKKKK